MPSIPIAIQPIPADKPLENKGISPSQNKVFEALRLWLSADEYRGWLRGNALKYQLYYKEQGGLQDLQKAQWFLNELMSFETEQKNKKGE